MNIFHHIKTTNISFVAHNVQKYLTFILTMNVFEGCEPIKQRNVKKFSVFHCVYYMSQPRVSIIQSCDHVCVGIKSCWQYQMQRSLRG